LFQVKDELQPEEDRDVEEILMDSHQEKHEALVMSNVTEEAESLPEAQKPSPCKKEEIKTEARAGPDHVTSAPPTTKEQAAKLDSGTVENIEVNVGSPKKRQRDQPVEETPLEAKEEVNQLYNS